MDDVSLKLNQYKCQREGTLFYYQTTTPVAAYLCCPLCGSKRVRRTGRRFPAIAENRPLKRNEK